MVENFDALRGKNKGGGGTRGGTGGAKRFVSRVLCSQKFTSSEASENPARGKPAGNQSTKRGWVKLEPPERGGRQVRVEIKTGFSAGGAKKRKRGKKQEGKTPAEVSGKQEY